MTKTPGVPALASDIRRGYLALGIAFSSFIVMTFVLLFTDQGFSAESYIAASFFLYWAFASLLTVLITWLVFRKASAADLKRWLLATSPKKRASHFWYALNGGGAASWAVSASFIAVAAVLVLSFNPQYRQSAFVVYTGIAVVVGSLGMTIVAYAVRYAREHAAGGGIQFPGTEEPVFMDFLYLAVQVSTTFSSSDVTITDTATRRLITANSLISFTFNTVIVALLVAVLVTASQS